MSIIGEAEFYDRDYFRPLSDKRAKGSYMKPYTWRNESRGSRLKAERLIELFHCQSILDVGCARGFLVRALCDKNIDAFGIDISHWAINHGDKRVEGKIQQWDIRNGLPLKDNSFDLVCSFHTLEHIESGFLEFIADEFYRVTRRWVYLDLPVGVNDRNEPMGDPSHCTYMPISYWIALFYKSHLLLDGTKTQHDICFPYFHNAALTFYKGDYSTE